jgi:hypothetical protein
MKGHGLRRCRQLSILLLTVITSGCAVEQENLKEPARMATQEFNLSTVTDYSRVDPDQVYTFVCELIVQKPSESTTNCADFGEAVFDIQWDSWSAEGASGRGRYSINDCEPDCASGTRHEALADVTLTNLKTDGKSYFLTDFTFETQKPVLAGYSNVGGWDVSDFYINVPEMRDEG